jgi:hypothetical protein
MTDRELLVAIKAQIDAQLAPPVEPPVDCVLSPWSGWAPITDWSECLAGTQTRTLKRTRTVMQEAANGGAVCDPVREETMVESQACVVTPAPDPTVFPPYIPTEPTVEEKAAMKRGEGYPERRVYKSAQWHDSETQDVDNMRHIHVEVAVPEKVNPGIHRFDIFSTLFHFQSGTFLGVRKVVRRTNTATQEWMPVYVAGREGGRRETPISMGSDGHMIEFWTPLFLDLRTVTTPGDYTFEIDVQVRRPDGKTANARIIWKMSVGGTTEADGRLLHGEGWVSPAENESNQFGYLLVTSFGLKEFESDPIKPIKVKAGAKAGRTVRFMVCKNPDLHQHPANYGTILHDWTFVATQSNFEKTIPQPDVVAGDRIMLRVVDASDPDLGAGATLAVVKVSK